MILTLTRDNTATKGLIVAQTDQTNLDSLTLHKPTELQELSINQLGDGYIQISMVISQKEFSVKINGVDTLIINGANQDGQTVTQISDTLSALFLESSAGGGGGGTVINPTDLYVPYRQNAGTFADSVIQQSIEPAGNDFKLDIGKQEVSISLHNDNNGMGPKIIKLGNAFPVISPFANMRLLMDFFSGFINMISEFISIGGELNLSNALITLQQSTGVVSLGDVVNNGNGVKVVIDDVNVVIRAIASGNTNLLLDGIGVVKIGDIDNVNSGTKVVVNDSDKTVKLGDVENILWGTKINIDNVNKKVSVGDADNINNGTLITVNDLNGNLLFEGEAIDIVNKTNGSFTNFKNATPGADTLINIQNLPNYTGNVMALGAGRNVGDLYRVSGTGQVNIVF